MSLFVENLGFSYEKRLIFKDVNFSAYPGQINVLVGSSGVGKTTFFKLISGLVTSEKGRIFLKSENGTHLSLKDNFTYMQQNDLLLPWRTVFQNLLLNFELRKTSLSKKHYIKKIDIVLEKMQLLDYKFAFPCELSGGMKQRIALARAILQDKVLMLLDEPFSSLDVVFKENLYDEIRNFVKDTHKSLVLITHDFRDALSLADNIFIISRHTIKQTSIRTSIGSCSSEQKILLENEIKQHLKPIT